MVRKQSIERKINTAVKKRLKKRRSQPKQYTPYRVVGHDLVTSLPDAVENNEYGTFSTITANPCYWQGTRIAQIAAAYQAYHINSIRFEYVPQVSVGYNGTVIMGTLWDSSPAQSSLQQTLVTSPGGCMTICYRARRTSIPLSGLQQRRFNTNGELAQSTNPFMFVAIVRGGQLAYQTPGETQVVPGYFIVHYDYSFYNPIGSGWTYGVHYNLTSSDFVNVDAANVSAVSLNSMGQFGIGTVFDYDNQRLKYRGSELENVPSNIHFNVYWNGVIGTGLNNINSVLAVKRDTISGIQLCTDVNDLDAEWVTLQPYRLSPGVALPAGMVGKVTVRLFRRVGSYGAGIVNQTAYPWILQAWYGVSEWELDTNSFEQAWYFQYPMEPTDNVAVRVKTDMGRHSTPLYVSESIWDFITTGPRDKTQPNSEILNYLWADPQWTNDDGEPMEEDSTNDLPDEALSRPLGLPPPMGPRLEDLEADLMTNIPFSSLQPVNEGATIATDATYAWVDTRLASVYYNLAAYLFIVTEPALASGVTYGHYKLMKLTQTSETTGWVYLTCEPTTVPTIYYDGADIVTSDTNLASYPGATNAVGMATVTTAASGTSASVVEGGAYAVPSTLSTAGLWLKSLSMPLYIRDGETKCRVWPTNTSLKLSYDLEVDFTITVMLLPGTYNIRLF